MFISVAIEPKKLYAWVIKLINTLRKFIETEEIPKIRDNKGVILVFEVSKNKERFAVGSDSKEITVDIFFVSYSRDIEKKSQFQLYIVAV